MSSDSTTLWLETLAALRARMEPVRVTTHDCGTIDGITALPSEHHAWYMRGRQARLLGRVLLVDCEGNGQVLEANSVLSPANVAVLSGLDSPEPLLRSPLTCRAAPGVCVLCFGADPETLRFSPVGDPAGAAAVASLAAMQKGRRRRKPGFEIGRTGVPEQFRSQAGGVVRYGPLFAGMELVLGKDYYSDDGERFLVLLDDGDTTPKFRLTIEGSGETYELENETQIWVADGEAVAPGALLFQVPPGGKHQYLPDANRFLASVLDGKPLDPPFVLTPMDGVVSVSTGPAGEIQLVVVDEASGERTEWRRTVARRESPWTLRVEDGDPVRCGDVLVDGYLDVEQLLTVVGDRAAALTALLELQRDLEARRVYVEDRHLELILAMLLRREYGT